MRRRDENPAVAGRGRVTAGLRFRPREVTVGLDIGSAFSKAAVIDHSGDAPRLVRIAVTPNDANGEADDTPHPERAAEAVASMFARERIEARDVVIGVGGRDVVSKPIEVDRMAETEARAVLPWEAEQHVPFDMEGVQLDFHITDPEDDAPRMTVLLAAARLEVIESRVSLLRQAGLHPAAVDVNAFALHNAFEVNHPDAMAGVTALVDIGTGSTTVNVLDDGLPVLTRDLRFGTGTLVRDLQRDLDLTAGEAAAVLRAEVANAGLGDSLAAHARHIAEGIERAARLVETQDIGLGIARVYLCGGGAGIPGLPESIAERLGVEIHVANAVERLRAGPEVADYPALEEVSPMLMLAVGLALRRPSAARRPGDGRTPRP